MAAAAEPRHPPQPDQRVRGFKVHRIPRCQALAVVVESEHTDLDLALVSVPDVLATITRKIDLSLVEDAVESPSDKDNDGYKVATPQFQVDLFSGDPRLSSWEEKYTWEADGVFTASSKGAGRMKKGMVNCEKPNFLSGMGIGKVGSGCCSKRRRTS